MEYPVYFSRPGVYDVDLITSSTLNVIPTRTLAIAISLDDERPQVVDVFSPATYQDEDFLGRKFNQNTRNNARVLRCK